MARKFRRIPQPPIDRSARGGESRSLRVGCLIAFVGAALILSGLLIARQVRDETGAALPEWELIKAVTRGGVRRAEPAQQAPATEPAERGPIRQIENAPDYCPT